MNRRGHLSRKIANVKIRPPPSAGSSRGKQRETSPDEVWREEFEDGLDDDEVAIGSSARPWTGITVTFTGVEDKPALSAIVKELGGQVESALTVTVTHVVASGFGSPKYNYAVENRIPVMAPSWIVSAHEQWLKGDEVDLANEQESHRLQPFLGLKIAISGIENIERRKQIIKVVNDNGGVYSKDLDRSCTHLVSAKITTDKPSEKVKWALRENASRDVARRRGRKMDAEDIKIVYEEWIWDCVAFRGRWKEEIYDARKPRPKARVRAEDVLDGSVFEAQDQEQKPALGEAEDEEPAALKRRKKEAMDDLVGEIISTTAITRTKTEVGDAIQPQQLEVEVAEPSIGRRETEKKPSMLHMPRSNAFDAVAQTDSKASKATTSFPATAPIDRNDTAQTIPLDPKEISGEEDDKAMAESSFFSGLRFSHVIEEKCDGLEAALVAHGGVYVPNEERLAGSEVDYVIVRLNKQKELDFVDGVKRPEVVTECWVEACCFEQRMISPEAHIVFRPLTAQMPIPRAQELNVHLSGFSTADTVYLRRLLKAIGGRLSEKMNRSTSHLVSATDDTAKAKKAPEWGVKLVRDSWLLDSARTGALEPESTHSFPGSESSGPSVPSVPSNRVLHAQTTSVNMSTMFELGDPIFERGKVPPASSPAERSLKPAATHVDQASGPDARAGFSSEPVVKADRSNVLSPPKAETERILNNASGDSGDAESAESKIARAASAPVHSLVSAVGLEKEKMSAHTSAPTRLGSGSPAALPDGPLAKKHVTDALRHIVGPGDLTPSARKPRRKPGSKPSGHVRQGSASGSSTKPTHASIDSQKDQELDAGAMQPRHKGYFGFTFGQTESRPTTDETFRVDYVDSAAEREKKRLLDAARKGERVRAVASEESPNKRVRR